jgi:hypothetical protein
VGFNLERRAAEAVNKVANKTNDDLTILQTKGRLQHMAAAEIPKEVAIFRGTLQEAIVRTFWYRCAFWLHFWALLFVFVTMLADLRRPRPCPRVDLLW